jgi:hypothetical protein
MNVQMHDIYQARQLATWLQAALVKADAANAHGSSSSSSTRSSSETPSQLSTLRSFALHGFGPLRWPEGRQQAAAAVPDDLLQACSSALCKMPHLQHLELQQLVFEGDLFSVLASSSCGMQLDRSCSSIQAPSSARSSAAAAAAAAAACLQQLRSLSLRGSRLAATDLPLLLQQLPNLQQLDLSGLVLGDAVWQQYSGQVLRQAARAIAGMAS